MRVVAAMSGGVDSAVAAARMLDAGHEVVGVHLALAQSAATLRESARGCCTIEDAGDARRVADRLGIPFYVWDMAERFKADVVEDFLAEYAAGRTPNPCLRCNEKIKFSALLDRALALGFDAVATGHYAQIVEHPDPAAPQGIRRELHRAVDMAKDQSYVLGVLDEEQLARAFFPLGDTTKPQIRDEAKERGFSIAKKPDSHDICFIADGDTRGFLAAHLGAEPGPIVDHEGNELGQHGGAHGYTVGQRRGLGLKVPPPDGSKRYVVSTDTRTNTVVVGPEQLLGVDLIEGDHLRWAGPAPTPGEELRVGAQIRAHGEEYPALARVEIDENVEIDDNRRGQAGGSDDIPRQRLVVHLAERIRGVAPGQSVVLYDGSRVIGSATISGSGRRPRERA
ncbi:tRNA 2-thiouridine(34) synthase MnmA [Ornithinimicrobium sp. Y1847]|uniref:tRNA 2-thiouridine(34) synthase MnmA n=1 Tax=Ornithinimicrobium sp. Y1847 TaxID=3405419 RepID=UPI003B67EC82